MTYTLLCSLSSSAPHPLKDRVSVDLPEEEIEEPFILPQSVLSLYGHTVMRFNQFSIDGHLDYF